MGHLVGVLRELIARFVPLTSWQLDCKVLKEMSAVAPLLDAPDSWHYPTQGVSAPDAPLV